MLNTIKLFCLGATITTLVACGSGSGSSSSNNQANLNTTYNSLSQGDFKSALIQVNEALAIDEKVESGQGLLLKSQVEQELGNTSDALKTLATYDKLFPRQSGDDFLLAQFEGQKGSEGNSQKILENLLASLNDNYSGIDRDMWWAIVEQSDDYVYFRTTPQFTSLEALKPDDGFLPAASCKENYSAFKSLWYGPEIWIAHKDMIYFNAAEALFRFLVGLGLPFPINEMVKLGLMARQEIIKTRERIKGCGVILHYTWITFPSGQGFVVGTQK